MNRKRKVLAGLFAAAVGVASLALTSAGPSGAAVVEVECSADDSVVQGLGTLNGSEIADTSQEVLDLIGASAEPPIAAPVSLTNPLAGSVDPVSVPPGSSALDITVELLLADTLVEGLDESGVTAVDLSDMDVTVAAGSGITGPDLTLNPADATINPASPTYPSTTGTETYDVTAGIGENVTWDLVEAHVAVHFIVPPSATIPGTVELTFGLECVQTGEGAFISSIVLPPVVAEGPVVDPLEATTDEDTPVEIDLNDGISDGPNETDPSTLSILAEPSDGTAVLGDNGVVTYTPDAGFVGEDQFAYQVCTIDVVDATIPTSTTSTTSTTTTQVPEGVVVDRVQSREVFCNSNLVTVTVEAAAEATTTTTSTTTTPATTPPAPPQQVAGAFTG